MDKRQRDNFASRWHGNVRWDVDMAAYSTLRAGGRADALVDVQSYDELTSLLATLEVEQIDSRVIGRGSNILVSGQGYPGVIIRLRGELKRVTLQDGERNPTKEVGIIVGGGCSTAALVSWCTEHGLTGLEYMTGIPGSVGGAVWMNAGAWGFAIGDRLNEVTLIDRSGRLYRVAKSGLTLSYRKFGVKEADADPIVIVSAALVVQPGDKELIRKRCNHYLERRRGKQPVGVASAGSFFKNPEGDSAGRLIDAAGLKGARCGQAMVSPVHANFIVNTGGATAADIIALMQQVQQGVFEQFEVRLEPEVQIF